MSGGQDVVVSPPVSRGPQRRRRVLLLGDSLAFHGPQHPELLTHPGIFPNVVGRALDAEVDAIARLGWTSRDAWWALTKDPYVYSILLPRADAVVLAVGGGDSLPVSLPPYLRDGIARLHPEGLRRRVRTAYHRVHPRVVGMHGGRLRALPLSRLLEHLTLCVDGIRYFHPQVPVVAMDVPPYAVGHVPVRHDNLDRAWAVRDWGRRHGVPVAEVNALLRPLLATGDANPDGLHLSWTGHERVGLALAARVAAAWSRAGGPAEAGNAEADR